MLNIKIVVPLLLLLLVVGFIGGFAFSAIPEGYKHQITLPMFCDSYLTYKKSDVPIACYEYFGIK